MSNTSAPDPVVRIEFTGGSERTLLVDVRLDEFPRPVEAARARLWQSVDWWGHVELYAVLDGRSVLTFWDRSTTQISQKADATMPEHVLAWCRRVHMNLVMSYCQIGDAHLSLRTSEHVFSAATGERPCRPSREIDRALEVLGEACRWAGVHRLWATGVVADRTDDATTDSVEFIFETKDGNPIGSGEILRTYLARLLGRDVSLTWRQRPGDGDGDQTHITIKKTRELWTAEA